MTAEACSRLWSSLAGHTLHRMSFQPGHPSIISQALERGMNYKDDLLEIF